VIFAVIYNRVERFLLRNIFLKYVLSRKDEAVSITINIHKTHREYTDEQERLEVNGQTIGECIKDLIDQYPGMKKAVFDAKGKLLSQIEIYLNMESAYPDELKKPVRDGDEIHIVVMLAGG
jgi:molybdopterin converting factor small subunit